MIEFKVGDKIVIGKNSIAVTPGTSFVVVEKLKVPGVWIDCNAKEVDVKYVSKGYVNSYADFKLADEKKVMPRFAVGDRVISIKNTPEVPEGFIGYVVKDPSVDALGRWDYAVRKENHALQTEYFTEDELELLSVGKTKETKPDVINSPKHYSVFESVEAIQVIASSMTQEQFYGYCLGNILKYRLRAGGKDDVMQELGKADKYQELYTQHKHLCKEGK